LLYIHIILRVFCWQPIRSKNHSNGTGTGRTSTTTGRAAALAHFYRRRVQRIVPAFAAVAFLTLTVGRELLQAADFAAMCADARWALTFTANLQYVFTEGDYFAKVGAILIPLRSL